MRFPPYTDSRASPWRLVAALAGLTVLWLPLPARAAVTCSFSGSTLSVTLSSAEDAASIVRTGAEIEVRSGPDPVACGGTPTVTTVNTVVASDTSSGATALTIDLSGGLFEPGATVTGEGTSPEIEFQINLAGQFPDRLTLVGTGGPDEFSFASAGVNLNGGETATVDVDVVPTGVEEFEVRAGAGADSLMGAAFSSRMILRGEDGADDLDGGSGPDELFGGAGADGIGGSGGADRLVGDADGDILAGGEGADDLLGGGGIDDLIGGNGDDRLDGGAEADTEDGSAGNDAFDQGPVPNGGDTLAGGTGVDLAAYDLRSGNLAISLATAGGDGQAGEGDSIGSDVESLLGGSGNDSITGAPVVNNTLRGGPGSDALDGGTGDDTVDGDAGNDALTGGAGLDTASFFGGPAVTVDLGAGTATGNGTDSLTTLEHVEGGSHADSLLGDGQANTLNGRGGADALAGGGGNDVLRGGEGGDTVTFAGSSSPAGINLRTGTATGQGSDSLQSIEHATGGESGDSLVGTDLANRLIGGGGTDVIQGFAGDDDLRGSGGDDAIDGNGGKDTFAGGDGNDSLVGQNGGDVFLEGEQKADNGADVLSGGSGRDLVSYAGRSSGVRITVGARGADGQRAEGDDIGSDIEKARGSSGPDLLVGNGGADTLTGAGGNDHLQGKGGIDRLLGGGGRDRLDGGPGNDVCKGGGGRNVLKDCARRRRR